MELQKTEKTVLTDKEILDYIMDHELHVVPDLTKFWDYYEGRNQRILNRKTPDENNPNNKIPVPYGRKIVNTFTGYAYRPKYISYKANIENPEEPGESPEEWQQEMQPSLPGMPEPTKPLTPEELFVKELKQIFDQNNEHIKTSRAGRNTAIFGVSYEILYVEGTPTTDQKLPVKAVPKFFTVDPRTLVVLYDFSPEPKIQIAIRFYKITAIKYKVEVYYPDKVVTYDRTRKSEQQMDQWQLTNSKEYQNFYGKVPVVAYYMGDEMKSIIEPILPLIDAYDTLYSDSMNEFDRFAFAYMIMKQFGLTPPQEKKEPGKLNEILKNLKRRRVFENLSKDADVKFLTKDIPDGFIKFMTDSIREQIHIQSHVPDFTADKMAVGASGTAYDKLMFDFENLCSSVEADFDTGLTTRIELIAGLLTKLGRPSGTIDMVSITHRRNLPNNLKDLAQTALTMKQAGFSRKLIAQIMPDDIVPNVDEELERQDEDMAALTGGFGNTDMTQYDAQGNAITDYQGNPLPADQNQGGQ